MTGDLLDRQVSFERLQGGVTGDIIHLQNRAERDAHRAIPLASDGYFVAALFQGQIVWRWAPGEYL